MCGLCIVCDARRLYAVTCCQCWVRILVKLMPHLVRFWATYCLLVLCASTVTAQTVIYCVQTCRQFLLHKELTGSLSAIPFSCVIRIS